MHHRAVSQLSPLTKRSHSVKARAEDYFSNAHFHLASDLQQGAPLWHTNRRLHTQTDALVLYAERVRGLETFGVYMEV